VKTLSNIVTVDVEDWYHICGTDDQVPTSQWDKYETRVKKNTEKILQAFLDRKIMGTFFVLGYIAEHYPEIVEMIEREGHEIATHGYSHMQVYRQKPEDFKSELLKSKDIIESISGKSVYGYRAPEWSIGKRVAKRNKKMSAWVLEILAQSGFHYDSSIAPLRIIGVSDAPTSPYTIRTEYGDIKEVPPLVMSTFMGNIPIGGGWGLRMMSYLDIKNTIKRFNQAHHPVLIYIHPWEIDENLPRLKVPLAKRFACYGMVKNSWKRFLRLIDDFEFTSIQKVLSSNDHNSLPIYDVHSL
jgi:polysaccharide deacetylase family protein (PEP-CTERM system associated)